MHALLFPIGSYGDVHPYVGLGRALAARGHRVTAFACPYFRSLFERAELDCVDIGTTEQYERAMGDPRLWHPRSGFKTVFEHGVIPNIRPQLDAIHDVVRDESAPGDTVVLSSCLGLGGRIAQEAFNVPFVSVHLQPVVLWSDYESPRFPGTLGGPAWWRRLQFWLGERFVVDPMVKAAVNPLRKQLGLAPMSRTIRWWHSTLANLCLFPEWFAPRQPDWPAHTEFAGFPLWDESALEPLDPAVEQFLAEGPPPIVFTPGSANQQAADFFAAAFDACRRLDRRGLFLSKFPEQIPPGLPSTVRHFEYVPFNHVFSRSAAVVHHGGIGTTAQALRAGVPQLLMPMAHDQPDNALRLERLGIARWLSPRAFRGPRVAAALESLLGAEEVASACRRLAAELDSGETPLDAACSIVETAQSRARENGP